MSICNIKASGSFVIDHPSSTIRLLGKCDDSWKKNATDNFFPPFQSIALTYSPHLFLHLIATQPILPYPVCYYMKYQDKAKKALPHLQNLVAVRFNLEGVPKNIL